MAGLWDVLVGAATGAGGQLERQQEQQRKLQQIWSEAQAKSMYPDPMTAFLLRQFGVGAGTSPTPSGQTAPTIPGGMPSIGGLQPTGMNVKGLQLALPPEEQARRKQMMESATIEGQVSHARQVVGDRLNTIEGLLQNLPASDNPQVAGMTGMMRRRFGVLDPQFREVQTTIDATLGPFLEGVEQLSRGRLTQGEINNLGNMIRDLPLLSTQDRTRRLQLIRSTLKKADEGEPNASVSGFPPAATNPYLDEAHRRGLIK